VYSRKLGGKTLTFGHEGILYKNSFIMYDKGTESLWVHVSGIAVTGPMKGRQLEFVPSTITPWKKWKRQHPNTTVLTGRRARGMMGSYSAKEQESRYGLSVGQGKKVKLYAYSKLKSRSPVTDKFDGTEMVIIYDPDEAVAVAWETKFKGKPLRFEAAGKDDDGLPLMNDRKSKTTWNAMTGKCVEGSFKGERLTQVVATPWLINRWQDHYPGAPQW